MEKYLGLFIAQGKTRKVFVHKNHSGLVIKKAKRQSGINQNRNEWSFWTTQLKLRKYLMPCIEITDDGVYLLQIKGTPTNKHDYRLTNIIKDSVKPANWVILHGQRKLCDYGLGYRTENSKERK